ncbi:MAG TPA: hypothetical protein VJL08_05640 [Dehalococcoidia bacterium]|nr:hypothetical protein [Dehalococcoidia bacterium]
MVEKGNPGSMGVTQCGTIAAAFFGTCGHIQPSGAESERSDLMWWQDILWGLWNGLTAWVVLIVHVFGGWDAHTLYNAVRSGNWYDFGFLVGAGSPLLGLLGARRSKR